MLSVIIIICINWLRNIFASENESYLLKLFLLLLVRTTDIFWLVKLLKFSYKKQL